MICFEENDKSDLPASLSIRNTTLIRQKVLARPLPPLHQNASKLDEIIYSLYKQGNVSYESSTFSTEICTSDRQAFVAQVHFNSPMDRPDPCVLFLQEIGYVLITSPLPGCLLAGSERM